MSTTETPDTLFDLRSSDDPLGLRLRRAREALGLSIVEAAERMRLRAATVEAMEREDLDSLGAAVYVRGYYASYCRLVAIPEAGLDRVLQQGRSSAPELRSAASVPRSRVLFDRYALRTVYALLTALIVVPVILLATRDQLPGPGARLTSLETAPVVDLPVALPGDAERTESGTGAAVTPTSPQPPVDSGSDSPVMASLAPFLSAPAPGHAPTPPLAATGSPLAPPQREAAEQGQLVLEFVADSWVEVLASDGRRLEYGLVRAGEIRRFAIDAVARVSLGNASAVGVRMNGNPTDIAAFQRANVARFTVSSAGPAALPGG